MGISVSINFINLSMRCGILLWAYQIDLGFTRKKRLPFLCIIFEKKAVPFGKSDLIWLIRKGFIMMTKWLELLVKIRGLSWSMITPNLYLGDS